MKEKLRHINMLHKIMLFNYLYNIKLIFEKDVLAIAQPQLTRVGETFNPTPHQVGEVEIMKLLSISRKTSQKPPPIKHSGMLNTLKASIICK